MLNLILYEPEIPQNTGSIIRLATCLDINIHIIEPCGFIFTDSKFRRAGMDYIKNASIKKYENFVDFYDCVLFKDNSIRIIFICPDGEFNYLNFSFKKSDWLMVGKESTGIPKELICSNKFNSSSIFIKTENNCRSLNMAIAASMVIGEVTRQHFYANSFP